MPLMIYAVYCLPDDILTQDTEPCREPLQRCRSLVVLADCADSTAEKVTAVLYTSSAFSGIFVSIHSLS